MKKQAQQPKKQLTTKRVGIAITIHIFACAGAIVALGQLDQAVGSPEIRHEAAPQETKSRAVAPSSTATSSNSSTSAAALVSGSCEVNSCDSTGKPMSERAESTKK